MWIALVAMCGLAFGPSISRALGLGSVEVAMAAGHAHDDVAMDMSAAMSAQTSMHGDAHMPSHDHAAMATAPVSAPGHQHGPSHSCDFLDCCALCAVAASPFSVVAIVLPAWSATEISRAPLIDRAGSQPRPRALWSTAAPRGPPILS